MFKSTLLKVIPSLFKGPQDNKISIENEQYQEKLGAMTDQSFVKTINHVIHSYNITHLRYKLRIADAILEQHKDKNTIVFCGRKRDKVLLDRFLGKLGYQTDVIDHYRNNLTDIHFDTPKVFIVTDGVDVSFLKEKVNYILHFDMPLKPSDYLTRLIMIFGTSEATDIKSSESHLIATMREFSALQILQENYHFESQEIKLEAFPNLNLDVNLDSNSYDIQLNQTLHNQIPTYENSITAHQYYNKPYPKEISSEPPKETFLTDVSTHYINDTHPKCALPHSFESIKNAEQKGFEEEPPAFFKKKS